MSDKLRVAVITEPTAWHQGALIDALHNDEVGEVAVGDVTGGTFDEVRAGGAGKVSATYTDLDKLYRDFDPQVALVTMEPWRMPPVITQALEAGAHVFHEKPGYVDIDDYRTIYRLAKSRGLHLAIAYISRAYPIVQEARRLIAEGFLGDLLSFQAWFVADQERTIQNPAAREQYDVAAGGWFFSKELGGGGHLTILGCHYLDLIRHIAGSDFKSVSAFCRNVGGEAIAVEDAAVVNLEFHNGMVGNLNSGYYTSSAEYGSSRHNGLIIWGRDGWLKFNPNGESNQEPMQWASYSGSQASAPLKSWTFDKAGALNNPYRVLTGEFFRACLGEGPPPIEPEAGMWVNEVTTAAYASSDSGQMLSVSIPEV